MIAASLGSTGVAYEREPRPVEPPARENAAFTLRLQGWFSSAVCSKTHLDLQATAALRRDGDDRRARAYQAETECIRKARS